MPITAIAAYAKGNRAIGLNGDIPWHSSGDLHRFKEATWGSCLIMGRETAESIGHALPGRRTIVLTRQNNWSMKGVETASSLTEALLETSSETSLFIAGGAEVYREAMPYLTHMLLTVVDVEVEGDRFFPEFERHLWLPLETSNHDESPSAVSTLYKRRHSYKKAHI